MNQNECKKGNNLCTDLAVVSRQKAAQIKQMKLTAGTWVCLYGTIVIFRPIICSAPGEEAVCARGARSSVTDRRRSAAYSPEWSALLSARLFKKRVMSGWKAERITFLATLSARLEIVTPTAIQLKLARGALWSLVLEQKRRRRVQN